MFDINSTQIDNPSGDEELAAFLSGDITSLFLASTGLNGVSLGIGVEPAVCPSRLTG